ncbi:MAG: hypothetical protein M1817_002604 [Caeruleum heppii]|nr:MAG: hypothetical protein M1817_002604 [Caeruleum heppii]
MATVAATLPSPSHLERTAQEPRHDGIHRVLLRDVIQATDTVRLLRLGIVSPQGIQFRAGQWLDVFVPGVPRAGGFTITSIPRDAQPITSSTDHSQREPFLELAVQRSPRNPPAAWLWQPREHILGGRLLVRVGGSFTWPPPDIDSKAITRAVFVAGGVGINPLISMLSHLAAEDQLPKRVHFSYTMKDPGRPLKASSILFLERLQMIASRAKGTRIELALYLTGQDQSMAVKMDGMEIPGWPGSVRHGRITQADLVEALGPTGTRASTVAYVCGPAGMTDELVGILREAEGMTPERVVCEKWW